MAMTTITILPEKEDSYRALAGDKESTGRTAGEALDTLTAQLSNDERGTLVIVQNYKADEFFDAAQQARLTELMRLRRSRPLSSEEEQELESLIEAELDGARLRTRSTALRSVLEEIVDLFNKMSSRMEKGESEQANVRAVRQMLTRMHRRFGEGVFQESEETGDSGLIP